MLDFIKKAILAGVGAASFTAEKAEKITKEMVAKGKMTEAEGRKFILELQQQAEESKNSFKRQTEEAVNKVVEKMNLVQTDEIQVLKQEVEKLRAELEELKEG